MIELADRIAVELAGENDKVLRSLEDRLELSIDLRASPATRGGWRRRRR
jgi:hypothetical protein